MHRILLLWNKSFIYTIAIQNNRIQQRNFGNWVILTDYYIGSYAIRTQVTVVVSSCALLFIWFRTIVVIVFVCLFNKVSHYKFLYPLPTVKTNVIDAPKIIFLLSLILEESNKNILGSKLILLFLFYFHTYILIIQAKTQITRKH